MAKSFHLENINKIMLRWHSRRWGSLWSRSSCSFWKHCRQNFSWFWKLGIKILHATL